MDGGSKLGAIKFKDLSWQLKIAIVGGYASVVFFGLSLLVGMIEGAMGI